MLQRSSCGNSVRLSVSVRFRVCPSIAVRLGVEKVLFKCYWPDVTTSNRCSALSHASAELYFVDSTEVKRNSV